MSKIHFLPVSYGDSFVIECEKGGQRGVVLVDGGPQGYGEVVEKKVEEVGTPDLMVLTHYDNDHIGGLTDYIKSYNGKGKLPAKEVWANCAGYARVDEEPRLTADGKVSPVMPCSITQGVQLARLLDAIARKGELTWSDNLIEGFSKEFPFATVEVVSPTAEGRQLAVGKQEKVAATLKPEAATMANKSLDKEEIILPLEDLAKDCPKPPSAKVDAEVANAASIAILLRCDDLSILMLGDCYPHNVVDYLRKNKYSETNPLEVDFVKVAHHGSRHNTSNELLDLIKCNHFIISTNGAKFGHPDREAFAHILCHPTRDRSEKVHFYLNYDMDTLRTKSGRFILDGEPEAYNFEIHESVSEIAPLERKSKAPVTIDSATLNKLTAEAIASPRLRMNLDLRNSTEDQSQRMLNAIQPGSVLPIHRHLKSSETVVCLRGHLQEIFYDDNGMVTEVFDLIPGSDCMGLNIPKGQWHTVVALKSGTVILETKDGPYAPLGEDEVMNL